MPTLFPCNDYNVSWHQTANAHDDRAETFIGLENLIVQVPQQFVRKIHLLSLNKNV